MRPPSTTPQEFVIRGGGYEFESRRKEMFDQLTQAEKEFSKDKNCSSLSEADQEILRDHAVKIKRRRPLIARSRSEMTQYRGKESIFKRPNGPAPLAVRKTIADHHINPHKWTKYTLEDVQIDKMSDKTNAEAAFSFLKELRARRKIAERSEKGAEEKMETEGLEIDNTSVTSARRQIRPHMTFRKPTTSNSTEGSSAVVVDNNDKPMYRNSKIVLPEYVVGQKQKKTKTRKPVEKVDRSKQLKLAHLDDIDE